MITPLAIDAPSATYDLIEGTPRWELFAFYQSNKIALYYSQALDDPLCLFVS